MATAALGALLSCPSPALDAVTVRGARLDVEGGIRTRARAAAAAERWTEVSARVKIVELLADALLESTEGRGGGDDAGEADWESASSDSGGGALAAALAAGAEDALAARAAASSSGGAAAADADADADGDPLAGADPGALAAAALRGAASVPGFAGAVAALPPAKRRVVEELFGRG